MKLSEKLAVVQECIDLLKKNEELHSSAIEALEVFEKEIETAIENEEVRIPVGIGDTSQEFTKKEFDLYEERHP